MCRYLFPAWCIGFVLRHLVLFPLRLLLIFLVMTSFCAVFFPIHTLLKVSYSPSLLALLPGEARAIKPVAATAHRIL